MTASTETPERRAALAMVGWHTIIEEDFREQITADLAAAIREAVAAEREAAAEFVDAWFAPIGIVECARMKKAIAAALRARSRP